MFKWKFKILNTSYVVCRVEIIWKNFETSGGINLRRFMSCADCVLLWKIEGWSWFWMSTRQLSPKWYPFVFQTINTLAYIDAAGTPLKRLACGNVEFNEVWRPYFPSYGLLLKRSTQYHNTLRSTFPVHFARFSKRQEVKKTSSEGNIKDIADKKETWQPRSRKGFIPVRRRQSSSNFEPTTNYFFKLSKVSHWL